MPGTSASSCSSMTRFSASLASTRGILLTEVLELAQLAVDLLIDVQRLLALALAALVPGYHQLAHLLTQPAVGAQPRPARLGRQQLLDLCLDVQRLPALGEATIRASLDHLADLLLAYLGGDRVNRAARALREVLLEGELPLADPLQSAAGSHGEDKRPDGQRDEHDDDQDRAELQGGDQGHHAHLRSPRCEGGRSGTRLC